MLALLKFYDIVEQGDELYNSYKGKQCNIGIIELKDGKITDDNLKLCNDARLMIAEIPEHIESILNIIKIREKLVKSDKDFYDITTAHVNKQWIVANIKLDKALFNLLCINSVTYELMDRYFYTRYIKDYIIKHEQDLYSCDLIYDYINHIAQYSAVTPFEKKIQQKLTNVLCTFVREYNENNFIVNRKNFSKEFVKCFGADRTVDDIIRDLLSVLIMTYVSDYIIEIEMENLNCKLREELNKR